MLMKSRIAIWMTVSQATLTLSRQDYATASRSKDTVAVSEKESKTIYSESTLEAWSSVERKTSLSNTNDAQLAENVNRFEAAIQLIKERSTVTRQTTLSNANDAQLTENVNRFEAAIQVIKECQGQNGRSNYPFTRCASHRITLQQDERQKISNKVKEYAVLL
jgi:exonuclease VII small subunit